MGFLLRTMCVLPKRIHHTLLEGFKSAIFIVIMLQVYRRPVFDVVTHETMIFQSSPVILGF